MKTENGISNLNFGQALDQLKRGEAIARKDWVPPKAFERGKCVYLNKGSRDLNLPGQEGLENIEGIHFSLFERGDKGTCTRLPDLGFLTETGSTFHGWVPSQQDMLAEDWCVVDVIPNTL